MHLLILRAIAAFTALPSLIKQLHPIHDWGKKKKHGEMLKTNRKNTDGLVIEIVIFFNA
jgi:hypothetical protein